jgi:hypothetical protein
MFGRNRKSRYQNSFEIKSKELSEQELRQLGAHIVYVCNNFNEALKDVSPKLRGKIEAEQEDLRQSREAGYDLANQMAKEIIN